jgi:hypothetical protein
MAERLSRQRMIVSRMERIGEPPSIELAYQLLRLMQQSMDAARYGLAVLDAFDRRPTPVGV